MQDKDKLIDKKFTDRAWGEMSRLLDEEMPVRQAERRRPVVWWLFFGLIVGLAGSVAYFHFSGKNAIPAMPPAPVQGAKAELPVAGASIPDETTAGLESNPVKATTLPGKIEKQRLEKRTPKRVISTTSIVNTTPIENTIPPGVKSTPSVNDDQNTLSSLFVQPLPEAESKTAEISPDQMTMRSAAPVEVALLPMKQLLADGSQPAVAGIIPHKKRVRWSVYGSGMSGLTNGANGLGAGVIASRQLKKSKFSIESGLGYSFIQQPLSLIFTGLLQGGAPNFPTGENEGYSIYLGDSNLSAVADPANAGNGRLVKPLNMHSLNVPVSLNYRFAPRLSLCAGLNAALILYTSSDYPSGGVLNRNLNLFKLNADETAVFGHTSSQASATLNDFEVAATGGMKYDLSPRLAVDLQYQAGLTDLIRENNKGDHNRLLRLTFRWYLGNRK